MTDSPRTAAQKAGDKFYNGQKCQKAGHGIKRYASNGTCYDCCRARDAEAFAKRKVTVANNEATSFCWPVFIIGNPSRITGVL